MYYSRRTGRVIAGPEPLVSFLNGDRAPRRPADKLPSPRLTPAAIAKFRDHVECHVKRTRQSLVYTSRGRRLIFYWAPTGGRLLVRIRPATV